MIRLEGFFKNGDFTVLEKREVKEEECYNDSILLKKISEKKVNKYYRYFETRKDLNNWLNNFVVIN